ncbi:hypothetical protein Y1Q_0009606 [Alligator mississippiensis]|uniref:Uncharacterized protein n=1 Tax=Alligator mississippiensis TaxID=8496 RepID=A0A151NUI2_ALLMI|nr:hypothetical protein Y1Q_0009606 [Alligator mississippiensis]
MPEPARTDLIAGSRLHRATCRMQEAKGRRLVQAEAMPDSTHHINSQAQIRQDQADVAQHKNQLGAGRTNKKTEQDQPRK